MRVTRLLLFLLFCPVLAALAELAEIVEAPPINRVLVTPFPYDGTDALSPQGHEIDLRDGRHIRLTGPIEEGDAEKLQKILGESDRWTTAVVSLNSPGGDYRAGLALSDLILTNNLRTFVDEGDQCLSACALAFLGGRQEFLRNITWTPSRYVHAGAKVGFHAPFNTEYPNAPGLNTQGARLIAELYYSQARGAIRALQGRIADWQVMPELVFDMLGKGPNEFLLIERYRELMRNQITVVADTISRPKQIGALEALLGCTFVLSTVIEPADDYRDTLSLRTLSDVASLDYMRLPYNAAPYDMTVNELGSGMAVFNLSLLISGRGPFACTVTNHSDGQWRVSVEGDMPLVETRMNNSANMTLNGPYALNSYTALGYYVPWTAMGQPDLYLYGEGDLFDGIPQQFLRTEGPSFSCSGALDAAAKIICRFPILARADAVMVEIYNAKSQIGVKGLGAWQRTWLSQRDSLCRPTYIDQNDPFSLTMAGYCLLDQTMRQTRLLMSL